MMTKASYLMNEHIKNNVSFTQQINASMWMCRSRLPFQQGLDFIGTMFAGKHFGDMYAHQYFIEKQTDPTQPSPQFHLTEEYQGMAKVMKGLRYMTDKSAKLDNTTSVTLDKDTGAITVFNPGDIEEATWEMLMDNLSAVGEKRADVELARTSDSRKNSKPSESAARDRAKEAFAESSSCTATFGCVTPSAVARSSAASAPLRRPDPSLVASVQAIVLPTRQALWFPLVQWTRAFPDAVVYASNAEGPTGLDKKNIEEVLSADEFAALLKRVVPISALPTTIGGDVALTKSATLIRVLGDLKTDEYVMHHKDSESLSCTDLFHGSYGDYDPLNSWMCRVFFKFMKEGDYKRVDIPPKYKMDSVMKQQGLKDVQRTVLRLCNEYDWSLLMHAHGTPPLMDRPKDYLMLQWGLMFDETRRKGEALNARVAAGEWREQQEFERAAAAKRRLYENPELEGEAASSRPEDDFLLRRRKY